MENYIKVEIPQSTGMTVKETIIQFFQKVFDREDAEKLYNAAEYNGLQGGTSAFDASIEMICKEAGLNSDELADIITKQNTTREN